MNTARRPRRRQRLARAASALLLGSAALAAPTSAMATDARAQIERRLEDLERLWAAADAKALTEQLYTDGIVIAGEGMPGPVEGKQQAEQLVAELIKGSRTAEVELKRFNQLGPEAASTWVVWRLPAPEGQADPVSVRSLFVWEKQGGEWRISADMYSVGSF
jgi:uncharacterized protein (TIGR02246 family)